MRKALIGILLAGTIATPLAAQEGEDGRRTDRQERAAEHYQRLEQRNQQRHELRQERIERRAESHHDGGGDHHGRRAGNEHRELHRDYRREHRELHRDNPTRREHRQFHREVNRDHRQVHRDTHREVHRDYRQEHRDLHRHDPTRREHRQFHRQVNRDHNRYHRQWDQGWRRDRRYDWQGYRYSNRDLFSPGYYYAPYRGHRYSRFSIGGFLGSGFYSNRYWINDPWQYRLPPAYPGTQWVRYYNDVLLVDVYTGEVVDVIYNFFW